MKNERTGRANGIAQAKQASIEMLPSFSRLTVSSSVSGHAWKRCTGRADVKIGGGLYHRGT
jgi:hypothetical protein